MGKSLVIVESPAKARTISRFLGKDYVVAASIGHIRDLPESAADIPARYKGESWARLGVDVDHGYSALYVVPAEKKEQVKKLKALLEEASDLYLATDEDREGESISWHLREVLHPSVPVHRLVFHEITREAIERAIQSPRSIDESLVQAQEARRILDRLYGYEVSPLLWKKIRPRLSAGRVQSVAVRLVVEREQARMGFHSSQYWDVKAVFEVEGGALPASLVSIHGRNIAQGHDFDASTGSLKSGSRAVHLKEADARDLAARLAGRAATVQNVEEKGYLERPTPPFITSTLQQEANRKLRWSARRTMQVAQRLYENGWITYMRTDSTTLSEEALTAARELIRSLYGPEYLPRRPRLYRSSSKNAQEAHEAIRPAGARFRTVAEAQAELDPDEARLYDLIWKRTLACQMPDAEGTRVRVRVAVEDVVFQATGKTISFPGFRRVYVESTDDDAEREEGADELPRVQAGQVARVQDVQPQGHVTAPPPRLTEATLVKELESRGIGRPSTYATIIDTIQARAYVFKKGTALVPTFTAFAVTNLLVETLADLVDYAFTARMEDELDAIAMGDLAPADYLKAFYEGLEQPGLKTRVAEALSGVDARRMCTIPLGQAADGSPAVQVRVGRFGPFLESGELRVDLPEDLPPDEMDLDRARAMLESHQQWPRTLGTHPNTNQPIVVMNGPYGFYVQEGEKAASTRSTPRRSSLLKGMDPTTLDLETALRLLALPRTLGVHPRMGLPIQAMNGRFGPYLKCGETSRSLPETLSLLDVTLEEATAVLDAPSPGRGAPQSKGRELGAHPTSGAAVRLLSGRFGPYVTDGTTNASLPKSMDPDGVSLEEALSLLAEKAAAPPRPRKARKQVRPVSGAGARTRTPSRGARKPRG